jgi:ubiquinone/menaquinone biosynthesis C-methylase UbiE
VVTKVEDVFDRIAPGWYNFRHWSRFPAELKSLARRWQSGRLLNLGCGHGPDFLPFASSFELYGVDSSPQMLTLARKYALKFHLRPSLVLADVTRLPFADESFEGAISVATYHHLREAGKRQTAFNELARVLKPGGEAFITVWNRMQPRFWLTGKEVTVPWRTRDEVLRRYYYLFSYPEVEKLARQARFSILKSSAETAYRYPIKYFSHNICLLLKKPLRCY